MSPKTDLQVVMENAGWEAEDPATAGFECWARPGSLDTQISTEADVCVACIKWLRGALKQYPLSTQTNQQDMECAWLKILFAPRRGESLADELLYLVKRKRTTR